jgi:hypothetical protein
MKYYVLALVLSCIFCTADAQNLIAPGGVKGAVQWYVTDSDVAPAFRSRIAGNKNLLPLENASSVSRFNFHPSLVFTATDQLPVFLGRHNFNAGSYFAVYLSKNTGEDHIWHITENNKTELVLTTSRMADLGAYHYMTYTDVVPGNPKVNTYVQQKETGINTPVERIWYLGKKPASPELPVTSFEGLIPEIIAYDRVLSGQERLQVASYLALKYGVTLTEPEATYLNSSGEKIWDGREYNIYHHNIAGIGRDDSSGLEQKISASSNTPDLLSISTGQSLANNTFLLWGDNGMPLTPGEKLAGIPGSLQKKWLMIPYGNTHPFVTDLILDTKQIDAPLPPKPVYWLAIDRSGTSDFSLPGIEYKKMSRLDADGKAHFNEVIWDKSGTGKETWGCIVAQDLLLSTSIVDPACTSADKGSLQVRVLGGNPPYQLTVENNSGQLISRRTINNDLPESIENIAADKYVLTVIDATQQFYRDSFYVNNVDAPHPTAVAQTYELQPGARLTINAATDMPVGLFYQWSGPNYFQSVNPQVNLTQPGIYKLSCTKNGCSNTQDVVVTTPAKNIFDNNIIVYPNPSPGLFTVKIALYKPADIDMAIYDAEGKLISNRKLNGFANYAFTNRLTISGEYKIVFRSAHSAATKKLIVLK